MKQKEYPMDENYNQALQFLTDQIAERDKLKKQLIILSSKERPKVMRLLDELDKVIELSEQALAEEYEAAQKVYRLEEERDEQLDDLVRSLAGAYVHVKYRNPEMLAEMEANINNMPPEQAQQFYDCAARLEAGDLIRIIAQKGETREQTEEFLRNYRVVAAEKKRDEIFEDLAKRMKMVFIYIKYRHPEKLEEVRAALLNNYTPEEEKEFYDGVVRLEANELISLIAQKGETPEETEEFLRNFRAAESKS